MQGSLINAVLAAEKMPFWQAEISDCLNSVTKRHGQHCAAKFQAWMSLNNTVTFQTDTQSTAEAPNFLILKKKPVLYNSRKKAPWTEERWNRSRDQTMVWKQKQEEQSDARCRLLIYFVPLSRCALLKKFDHRESGTRTVII